MQPKMVGGLSLRGDASPLFRELFRESFFAMAANGLDCIRSSPLLTVDQLPASSHACIVHSPITNSLSVASAGLDGQIRLIQFEDGPVASNDASMDQTSSTTHKYVPEIVIEPLLTCLSNIEGHFWHFS